MDKLDCTILEALQDDFPLSERPYEVLADKLKIPCQQLCQRLEAMRSEGIIRRMGASLDSRKLGYYSTLAAVSVMPASVDQAAEVIGAFSEVTHSYLRKGKFNIWFTLIAVSNERIEDILRQIRSELGLEDSQILNLPVKRLFKLDARFKPVG